MPSRNNLSPKLQGSLRVPGDKSISHRALLFSLFTQGQCEIEELSPAQDCQSTIACLGKLGVEITVKGKTTRIKSPWLNGLVQPDTALPAENSGTTIRLLSGLLAGTSLSCVLDGDASLRKRPMGRVLNYLTEMGATVSYLDKPEHAPFQINGGHLQGQSFQLKVASAQVQTAIMLAGLQADGQTIVSVPTTVRDHTQRLFEHIGVPFQNQGNTIAVSRLLTPLPPYQVAVPADISSAAFFMVAAACLPGSHLTLTEVGLNSGRTLVIDVLAAMGADIEVSAKRTLSGEEIADITVKGGAPLGSATVDGATIATGIDEIPILALAGALSQGTFTVKDAGELRVKESDRLRAIVDNFRNAGAAVSEHESGFEIRGQERLSGGCPWLTKGDHRMAMTGLVANLICQKAVAIDDVDCVAVSYPNFKTDLESLLN